MENFTEWYFMVRSQLLEKIGWWRGRKTSRWCTGNCDDLMSVAGRERNLETLKVLMDLMFVLGLTIVVLEHFIEHFYDSLSNEINHKV